jgi:putative oxidoreductase
VLRKLMNPGPTDPMTSFGLLLLRIAVGVMMIYGHGWGKLMAFSEKSSSFPDLLGIGGPANMALAIGAEVFAAALIVLGLFTRVVAIPLAITMIVAAFIVHADDPFAKKSWPCSTSAPASPSSSPARASSRSTAPFAADRSVAHPEPISGGLPRS